MTAIPSHAAAIPAAERRPDPSMEEVLASIRKIIADEDAAPRPPIDPVVPIPRPLSTTPAPSANILTPSVAGGRTWGATAPSPSPGIPRAPGLPPLGLSRPAMAAPAPVPSFSPAPFAPAPPLPEPLVAEPIPPDAVALPPETPASAPGMLPAETGALLSAATTDSITSAFQALTASVALTKTEVIDRHVRDLLRPMLRSWLDDNLPGIVEKLVRLEIERVARGGR